MAALVIACRTGAARDCRVDASHADARAGSAACLVRYNDLTLLVEHRIGGKISVPGGAAARGETAQCTAHRETWEETGVEVEVGPLLDRYDYGLHLYACEPVAAVDTQSLEFPLWRNLEISKVLWMDPDEIRETDPSDWRFPEQRRELDRMPSGRGATRD
jgi:8-oxo-dGTP pyrophosphatase MutT (NUDIX family)